MKNRPWAYLDKSARYLYNDFELVIDESTIWHHLKNIKWSRKKAIKLAKERDKELRDDWAVKLSRWDNRQLIYIDESASNERTGDIKYGRSPKGLPSRYIGFFQRSKRWSILPAFTVNGYITFLIYHGSITASFYHAFIRDQVLPLCDREGGDRSILIMDNARIHHSQALKELCKEANVQLEFLPPYSPDYNPIEASFAILKRWIKRHFKRAERYEEAEGGYGAFLEDAVRSIQQEYSGKKNGEEADWSNLFHLAGVRYH